MKKTIKKSYTMRNIAMALAVGAATSMMLSTVQPAFARDGFNMSARTFMVEIHQTMLSGQVDSILAMINRLRAMKVNSISLDGTTLSLTDLQRLVSDGSPASVQRIGEYAAIAQTQRVRFETGDTQVASIPTPIPMFPTSSFG